MLWTSAGEKGKVSLQIRAAVRAQPFQHLEMPALRRIRARPRVPRRAVRTQPLQHLEAPALRRIHARVCVPPEAVRKPPLQQLEMPAQRRTTERGCVSRAAVRMQPLQHLEVPAARRICARVCVPRAAVRGAHCSTSRCPPPAAPEHVHTLHGQPFARIHCSILRCPPFAAYAQVFAFHGQPFSRNTFNSSRCPSVAAAWQRSSRRDRRPPRCLRCTALKHPSLTALFSSSSLNRSPVAATASRIARLTTGSRARSEGSSKFSDLRMCSTTRWLGRRGMTSPPLAAAASRSRGLLRA